MERYGKPRWPTTAFFGSYRQLNYRLDIKSDGVTWFRVRTHSGPGFSLSAVRDKNSKWFRVISSSIEAKQWLEDEARQRDLSELLSLHFSRIEVSAETIQCYSYPEDDDILPEGRQLSYCLSLIHRLWRSVPKAQRGYLRKAEFID